MPMTEDRALTLLDSLVKACTPVANASGDDSAVANTIQDLPKTYEALIAAHNAAFPAPVAVVETKKKKRKGPKNPNLGWPAGVKRADYKEWKAAQELKGVTENLNPQEYKRQLDSGEVSAPTASTEPATTAKPAAKKAASKEPAAKAPAKTKEPATAGV